MIQNLEEINKWHLEKDPWGYELNKDDIERRDVLLNEIPVLDYENVLDIGCGQGFITQSLPGKKITGVDISTNAIKHAKLKESDRLRFLESSVFDLLENFDEVFDLIVITGVLYKQYIGESSNLVYLIIDKLLKKNGVLVCVHINSWYYSSFPYLKVNQLFYHYRSYTHKLEIYSK